MHAGGLFRGAYDAARKANSSLFLPFHVYGKEMQPKKHLAKVLACIHESGVLEWTYHDEKRNIKHHNDGIIFTPEHDGYLQKQGTTSRW